MKEDVGMSKPKNHANKVGKVTMESKSLHITLHCKNKIVKITFLLASTVARI